MPLAKSVYQKLIFLFSTKTYVVGTQKNRLNETVLLSILLYTYVKTDGYENIYNFRFKSFVYLNLCLPLLIHCSTV